MMDPINQKSVAQTGFLAVTFALIVNFAYQWYCRRFLPPKKWKQVANLADLFFYPMKSMGVVKLERLYCDKNGLKLSKDSIVGDRAFMVVETRHGDFVSARKCGRLILIRPTIVDNQIILEAPQMEPLRLNVDKITRKLRICRLWGKKIFARDCGERACNWISRYISQEDSGYSIVLYEKRYADEKTLIRLSRYNSLHPFVKFFQGAFHDTTSFKLLTAESIRELNKYVGSYKLSALNFRANFLSRGNNDPYAEDDWTWIRIGDSAIFRFHQPIPRSQVSTLNPLTAETNKHNEPIRSLVRFRQVKDPKMREDFCNNPVFGIHISNYKTGYVQIGDPIYIADDSD